MSRPLLGDVLVCMLGKGMCVWAGGVGLPRLRQIMVMETQPRLCQVMVVKRLGLCQCCYSRPLPPPLQRLCDDIARGRHRYCSESLGHNSCCAGMQRCTSLVGGVLVCMLGKGMCIKAGGVGCVKSWWRRD